MNRDRIRGAFALFSLGDALGAPHEFWKWNSKTVYTGKLEIEPYRQRDARRFAAEHREVRQPVGSVTDDTQMTYCLMNSIIEEGEYNRDAVRLAYARWVATKPIDLGSNTRAVFGRITEKKYIESMTGIQHAVDNGTQQASLANGPLMRCLPLALLDDWDTVCRIDTNLSNPYRICRQSVVAYVAVCRALLEGESINNALAIIADVPFTREVRIAIHQALNSEARDISGKDKGLITHALYCSMRGLLMLRDGDSHTDVLRWVITQGTNTGKGDTDTNAAIAGGLLGAYLGFDAIMSDRVTRNNWRILQATASQVDHVHLKYVPHDFDNQIDELIDTLLADID